MNHGSEDGNWRQWLYRASRRRGFLWRLAIGTLLIAVAVGYFCSALRKPARQLFAERVLARSGISLEIPDEDEPDEKTAGSQLGVRVPDISDAFIEEVTNPAVRFEDVLHGVPALAPHCRRDQISRIREPLKLRFGGSLAELLCDYLGAWEHQDAESFDRLKTAAAEPTPRRYTCYMLGRVEMKSRNFGAAYAAFRKEAANFPDAHESRASALDALERAKDYPRLKALWKEPAYGEFRSPYLESKIAAIDHDWWGLLVAIGRGQLESYRGPVAILVLIAGIAWMFFLGHLGEWSSLWSVSALLAVIAFALGVVSTTPTVWLVVFEEDILHFARGGDLMQVFAYDIGGVGLREEVCKLALFVPLLPFLLRRQNELEAVIAASFVGLGFAIEENVGYFHSSEAASMAGRFLSANFFHIALTGMNGLSLYRVFARYRSTPSDFLYVFPLTVLAHGLYDALADAPQLEIGGYLQMIVYVLFSLLFFGRVEALRDNVRMTVGLSGAFVFGLSIVVGTVIVYQMLNLGATAGLLVAWPELLGCAGLVFMFFRAFNEQLAA